MEVLVPLSFRWRRTLPPCLSLRNLCRRLRALSLNVKSTGLPSLRELAKPVDADHRASTVTYSYIARIWFSRIMSKLNKLRKKIQRMKDRHIYNPKRYFVILFFFTFAKSSGSVTKSCILELTPVLIYNQFLPRKKMKSNCVSRNQLSKFSTISAVCRILVLLHVMPTAGNISSAFRILSEISISTKVKYRRN